MAEKTKDLAARQKPSQKEKPKQKEKSNQKAGAAGAGPALIGITTAKEDDLAGWYQELILKADLLAYSDIPGCYILLPPSFKIWETIHRFLDTRFEAMGVENCYFPLFISEKSLQTEKEHLEGFEEEVAWVTHGGKNKLADRLAIRPTSETAMYPFYAKKIRSHRDLPIKYNQWNNVVRWEFKHATPFLRSREFLWQEGHTAHLTEQDATKEVHQILDHYAACYEDLLAVPVVKGVKTDNEKFAGAQFTTTLEGFVASAGRGIQAATSHCLGQHFSKMFNITVEDPSAKEGEDKEPIHVWQNSWGFTTRSIGVMIMVHSDNKGLVVPPRVARKQVVIIPVGITAKTSDEARQQLYKESDAIKNVLEAVGVRVEIDTREGYSPGYKFNDWEMKGVPLRIEFGPKDQEKHQVTTSRRDGVGGKAAVAITDLNTRIPELLEEIQADLFAKAKAEYDSHRVNITDWDAFVPALNAKNVCLIPHCLGGPCEDEIKKMSARQVEVDGAEVDARAPSMGAKSLCIPFEQPEGLVVGETKCLRPGCNTDAKKWVLFGRSY